MAIIKLDFIDNRLLAVKMKLWGRSFTKQEILQRVGDISQVGGTRFIELREGNQAGVAAIDFTTGSGLNFTVLPSRGMDISIAAFNGAPLSWRSATGEVGPWYYESSALAWSRGFFGGLLATCGLVTAGHTSIDKGQEYPLHGRASFIPASNVMTNGEWDGDEYIMWAQGSVRETSVLGENLSLTRKIWCKMGEKVIHIRDTVENHGFECMEHMLVYHMNFGFPLLDDNTVFNAPVNQVDPWDVTWDQMVGKQISLAINEVSEREIESYNTFDLPQQKYLNRVYSLTMQPDDNGEVIVALTNTRKIGVYLKYDMLPLPEFTLWKMLQYGSYVVGIEPGNCRQGGRAAERRRGTIKMIEPGEQIVYEMELGVLETDDETRAIDEYIANISLDES